MPPSLVVVCDPEGPFLGFEDLGDVRTKYGEVVVGHAWARNDERPGWLRCPRCRDERRCDHPAEHHRSVSLTANPKGPRAETCTACGEELGRWVG
jgi:hypothetical protein